MPALIVETPEGAIRTLHARAGGTAMETIREAGIDELLALCGGVCSCATCHVFVDPAFAMLLPAMSADEDDLLESASHRDARSRLSCQIRLDEALSGLRLIIAEDD